MGGPCTGVRAQCGPSALHHPLRGHMADLVHPVAHLLEFSLPVLQQGFGSCSGPASWGFVLSRSSHTLISHCPSSYFPRFSLLLPSLSCLLSLCRFFLCFGAQGCEGRGRWSGLLGVPCLSCASAK